jgi:hypothetical protein
MFEWFHLAQLGSCEQDKELSECIKGGQFLVFLNILLHGDIYPFKVQWYL